MNIIEQPRSIYISSRLWHEYSEKVNTTPFINALEDKINLAKYGDGIQTFYFTFIVTKPSNFFTPARIFNRKKKEADISIEIPYEQIEAATDEEALQIMAEAYLKGIDVLNRFKHKGNFDVAAFKKDVEAIFAKDKWYEVALASR